MFKTTPHPFEKEDIHRFEPTFFCVLNPRILHQNHSQLCISGWLYQANVKGRNLQIKLKSASVQKHHLSYPKDIWKMNMGVWKSSILIGFCIINIYI